MKRLLFTIILVVIALYIGAYIGKDNLDKYSLQGGKKLISMTKTSCQWVKTQWQELGDKDA